MKRYTFPLLAVLCGILGLGFIAGQAIAEPAPVATSIGGPYRPLYVVALVDTAPAVSEPTVLPNPAESPLESGSLLLKLYKGGHLVPAIVLALFFALTLAQRWIAWLRTGWRKLAVAASLAGLGMLAERAAEGATPNMMMLMGAFGAAITLYVSGKGEPKAEAPAA